VHHAVHHAATVQHVIIDRAQQTLPVNVVNPDPLEHTVLRITMWVLVVAVITFIAVLVQIVLSSRQLSAVKQDLANNRRMIDETLRHPKFRAAQWSEFRYPSDRRDWINATVTVNLANEGDKLTPAFLLELLVPQDCAYNALPPGHHGGRTVKGVYYRVYEAQVQKVLFPNDVLTEVHQFQFSIKPGTQNFTCLWRVYDMYGKYPHSEYGQWMFTVRV
jgi:hypothetical protein